MNPKLIPYCAIVLLAASERQAVTSAHVEPYRKDVAEHGEKQVGLPCSDVRTVTVNNVGAIVAGAKSGWVRWKDGIWLPAEMIPDNKLFGFPGDVEVRQNAVG